MSNQRAIAPVAEVCQAIASQQMQDKIRAALPENVSLDRFTRVTLTAIQQNPDITTKDRSSLYNACVKCAADGLLPDGREAALVAFGQQVQYMPMVGGIIKRLAQAGITIDAQVVYENDHFEQVLGDDARIEHKAPKLGQPRGQPIGVYAIARLPNGLIMREVMDSEQVEQVRQVSRSKDSGPWKVWWTEMARKTVTRRLAKRLPILDPEIRDLVQIDPDDPDFGAEPAAAPAQPVAARTGRPSSLAAVVAQAAQSAPEEPTETVDGELVDVETGEIAEQREGDVF